jgi:cobalt-zinc-cadmium efflux system outer membrane protein
MSKGLACATVLLALPLVALGQTPTQLPAPPPIPTQVPLPGAKSSMPGATERITLDEAIRLAVQHNHALEAVRATVLQNQSSEITANLRPNPVLMWDAQFIPILQPQKFDADYVDNSAQFDLGIGYTFERGKKRRHRLQAARDVTTQSRWQVTDNERLLTFNVASQFINALLAESTLDFAKQDLQSFQQTVDVSEARYKAGDMSEGDLLKIRLQLLQFQTDLAQAEVARVQALAGLRQLLGYESVPDQYDVAGDLEYQPIRVGLDELKAEALRTRPDLQAAQQGVVAARSAWQLAIANGKRDVTGNFNYTHVSATNTGSFFANIQLPIFDRNQGEIARTSYVITQTQQQAAEAEQQAITDVVDAYYALQTNDQVIRLYQGGYVDNAKKSRDISEYAYRRGAASLLDYLDAERTYRANQLAYRQALASYMSALEQMRQAVGTRNLP